MMILLGNPGREYAMTRHNAGRILAGYGPFRDLSWSSKFKGLVTNVLIGTTKLYILQPETFMNDSGESARPAADFYRLSPMEILVVHDELELPFGTIEFRNGGGTGGHNGLRSLAKHLDSPDFWRLRIGIGRPAHGNVSAHVLSRFSKSEQEWLDNLYEGILTTLHPFLDNNKKTKTTLFE